jgi:hypothetical protein
MIKRPHRIAGQERHAQQERKECNEPLDDVYVSSIGQKKKEKRAQCEPPICMQGTKYFLKSLAAAARAVVGEGAGWKTRFPWRDNRERRGERFEIRCVEG